MILHIAESNKFTVPLFNLFQANGMFSNHRIIDITNKNEWPEGLKSYATTSKRPANYFSMMSNALKAEKIFVHGLFDPKIILFLFLQPWIYKKTYWIMLGGDLYSNIYQYNGVKYKLKEWLKKVVISRLHGLITYIDEDVVLARQWYKAKGKYYKCLMYKSNTYEGNYEGAFEDRESLHIMVGNSADPSNNHIEAFHQLSELKNKFNCLVVPLSYGDIEYALSVKQTGMALFGQKFYGVLEFIPLEEYKRMLTSVDIAIFSHRRQQGMGNIISLLGMGKTVYINSETTTWIYLRSIGVKVFDSMSIGLSELNSEESIKNHEIIKSQHSIYNLISQWQVIIDEQV